jgi:RNA polymerase sigma-70 factor (ECF subfamily)
LVLATNVAWFGSYLYDEAANRKDTLPCFFLWGDGKNIMKIKGHAQDFKAELAEKRPALFAYVRGIVQNAEIAEDITQEAMLRAHRSITALKDHNRFIPWLYRIATNVCRDHFRKNSRMLEDSELFSPNDPRDENAPRLDKVMECAEMGECVQRYFAELSDSYRAVILLHDVEGMKNKEIADILQISLDTAKIRLHRARKQLRNILEHVCNFYIDERGVLVCEPKDDNAAEFKLK